MVVELQQKWKNIQQKFLSDPILFVKLRVTKKSHNVFLYIVALRSGVGHFSHSLWTQIICSKKFQSGFSFPSPHNCPIHFLQSTVSLLENLLLHALVSFVATVEFHSETRLLAVLSHRWQVYLQSAVLLAPKSRKKSTQLCMKRNAVASMTTTGRPTRCPLR